MPIYSNAEIRKALDEKITAFNNYIITLNEEQFEATPEGKWSAGQNLDHLILSIGPLQLAYSLPKFILGIFFGKANRPSRPYEALVEKYKSRLASGGRASKPFIPKKINFTQKEFLLEKYNKHKEKLIRKIARQNEEDLDRYILPHPLLGKLTLREMLFFTIHHNEHHLTLLQHRK